MAASSLSHLLQVELVVKLLSKTASREVEVQDRVVRGLGVVAAGLDFPAPVLREALATWRSRSAPDAPKGPTGLKVGASAPKKAKPGKRKADAKAEAGKKNPRLAKSANPQKATPSPELTTLSVQALKARLEAHGLDAQCLEKAELRAVWENFDKCRKRPLPELQARCELEGQRFATVEECARYLTRPRGARPAAAPSAPPAPAAPQAPTAHPAPAAPPPAAQPAQPAQPAQSAQPAPDREQDAKREAGRIMLLRRDSFPSPMSWGFAVLGLPPATKEVPAVQSAYRCLMRKLHPDRLRGSEGEKEAANSAVEKVREAKEACERGLSRQQAPPPPRQLRSEALCGDRGRRRFRLAWQPPVEREAQPVRRYVVAAFDPAYGKALTVTVLEPDYSQELRSFVGIEHLTSYVVSEEELQKMPKIWTQKTLQVQVAAANEAGQSRWATLQIPLAGPGAGAAGPPAAPPAVPAADPAPAAPAESAGPGRAAGVRKELDPSQLKRFDEDLRKLRGSAPLRGLMEPLNKRLLQEWLRSKNWSALGSKHDLVERIIFIREAMVD
ncbi:unnamed protein product [Effrenium voratum]|nr:unnamed protein product [Effrenium voratum]